MRRTLLMLFLLVAGVSSAQIVNIPDANFKNYLLNYSESIDTNNDGEIQLSEAAVVTTLNILDSVNTPFSSLEGIELFTGLNSLYIGSQSLTELDLSALTQLTTLQINCPLIISLNLSGLNNVVLLELDNLNSLSGNLDVTSLQSIEEFHVVASSNISGVNFGTHPMLTTIEAFSSNIVNLNIEGCPNLESLSVQFGTIQSLSLNGCPNLSSLNLTATLLLEELDLSACNNLQNLHLFATDNLQTLIVGDNINLTSVDVLYSKVDNIDLSGCPNINSLTIGVSDIVGDVYVNLKNGNESYTSAILTQDESYLSHLYVCLDEGEETAFSSSNTENVFFSTYCNFTPGADYNTITGTVTFDAAGDGCDSTDALLPYTAIAINDGTTTGYSYTLNGTYNFYTQAGTFTVTPQFENDWFTTSPATVTFADANNNTVTQNFCVTPNGVHNDVEVLVVPLGAAQPGFDATYKIVFKNKGNQTLSGDVTFTYDDSVLDYVLALPIESSSATGSLSWSYSNLLPFETREITVTLNVNSPMETPAVNINDVLLFTATVTPVSGDETPADNTFEFNQTVVGSFDPNDIICLEGTTVSPDKIGEYLHYNVNFENTGTAPATFVVVKDIIDATKYDISTLQILNASHPMEARITGNKVEFYFDDINLAANGGKGNVTFKIKTLNSLTVNSSVTQQADIYFDYNWPIVTNEATTTFAVLSTGNFTKDTSVKLYPNPAKNTVNITAQGNIQTVQLYDVQGRLLQAANASGLTTAVDVSGRAAGIYFVKVTTDKGAAVEKLVKE